VGGFTVNVAEAARIGQRAENGFVGVMTGVMDQMASALGCSGHLLLIDCRDLSHREVPLPGQAAILVADTAVRRQLAASAYNERRAQCEAAAAALRVPSLRDATLERLDDSHLEEVLMRRARHVIAENARVLQAAEAFAAGDLAAAGRLMDESHASLRDLYEVSSSELDTMVDLLRRQPGCYGARLTGAGFGGCAVALMAREAVSAALPAVSSDYLARTGRQAAFYPSQAGAGAGLIDLGRA
jgi:galactokinase